METLGHVVVRTAEVGQAGPGLPGEIERLHDCFVGGSACGVKNECCYENTCVQLTLSVYSAGKTIRKQTWGKGGMPAMHGCLFSDQGCQIVALRIIILNFLLIFTIFLSFSFLFFSLG